MSSVVSSTGQGRSTAPDWPHTCSWCLLLVSRLLRSKRYCGRREAETGNPLAEQRKQDREAVGEEPLLGSHHVELGQRDPARLDDLAVVEREGSVVGDSVATA